jgi:hypothetical protein
MNSSLERGESRENFLTPLTVKTSLKSLDEEKKTLPKDETPLKFAISMGLFRIVDILLQGGAKVDS